jgi:murein DD-endopeptidase MepM/ murein hydrolase activator NlpD
VSSRTFILQSPHMEGDDIKQWQLTLNRQLRTWDVNYQLNPDGGYGSLTRSLTASVCHGLGLASASQAMAHGVTPELRVKLRDKDLTPKELKRYHGKRARWRDEFRRKHENMDVSTPLAKILQSEWGWTPPGHDGVDLICKDNAPLLAICKAKVMRADAGGWWGQGAEPSNGHPVSDGDGIVVLRSLVDVGPFKKGLNFGYGHAEGAKVSVGDVVEAGEVIARAGFAVVSHVHLMVNGRTDAKGVGDRDPMPFVKYAVANG